MGAGGREGDGGGMGGGWGGGATIHTNITAILYNLTHIPTKTHIPMVNGLLMKC